MKTATAVLPIAQSAKQILSPREFLIYGGMRALPTIKALSADLQTTWGTGPSRFVIEAGKEAGELKPRKVTDALTQLHLKKGNKVVFIHPHDDDSVLGAGTYLYDLTQAGIQVNVVQVTDGALGFKDQVSQTTIGADRKIAAIETYAAMGVDVVKNMHFLDFPDGSLERWRGITIENKPGSDLKLAGPLAALVKTLRHIQPDAVIIASGKDLHPDHQACFREGLWSLYQASEGIWLPLGKQITMPKVFEYAVYSSLGKSAANDIWNFHPKGVEFGAIAMRSFAETQADIISGITAFLAKPFTMNPDFKYGQWQRLKPIPTIERENIEARVQETGLLQHVMNDRT